MTYHIHSPVRYIVFMTLFYVLVGPIFGGIFANVALSATLIVADGWDQAFVWDLQQFLSYLHTTAFFSYFFGALSAFLTGLAVSIISVKKGSVSYLTAIPVAIGAWGIYYVILVFLTDPSFANIIGLFGIGSSVTAVVGCKFIWDRFIQRAMLNTPG